MTIYPDFFGKWVGEIFESTIIDEWRHNLNGDSPAHIGTRGFSLENLKDKSWVIGPTSAGTTDWLSIPNNL